METKKVEAGRDDKLQRIGTDAGLTGGVRQTIRRSQLHAIVPLADSTIYRMEQQGEFPRRFNLTPRCVVWDLAEVQEWSNVVDAWICGKTHKPILYPPAMELTA